MAVYDIDQPPRTLGHCADHGLTLRTYCTRCEALFVRPAAEFCRAFRDWTVEEMQRAGVLGCETCRRPVSVSIFGTYWVTHAMQMEHWSSDKPGYVRKYSHGMSG